MTEYVIAASTWAQMSQQEQARFVRDIRLDAMHAREILLSEEPETQYRVSGIVHLTSEYMAWRSEA